MDRYALVIGISQYQSAALSPLPKAAMDAEAIAQLLEKQGNFQVERLPRVWNRAQNKFEVGGLPVTRTAIIDELKTLLLKRAKNSEALIYFSGHGFNIYDELDEQQGFLAASDTQVEGSSDRAVKQQNGISLEFLDRVIKKSQIARLVMLLDCCHSGEAIARESLQKTLAEFSRGADYYLIAACRNFENARSLKGQPHSIFTGALLAGLAPENANSDGNITGDRLFDYIQQQLKGSRQQPVRLGGGRSIALVNYPQQERRTTIPFQPENPYLGLQAFEIEQAMYFHGRDRAIRALRDRLLDNRFLAVIGASGCGKSSLVKAGLIYSLRDRPLLDSSDWEIATLTPGDSPLERLIETLAPLHDRAKPFLLFVDQFEEIFTLCKSDEQRKSFFRLMQEEATNLERQGRVIVAIRGDFLDRCAEYAEVASLINRTQPTTYFVEPLSLEELQRAIAQPATQHGVTFDPGLISKMAEDVFSHPGALPLLQYALRELWRVCIEETETPQPHLTWQGYEQIGEVGGALDKRANLIYTSLNSEAQQACVRRLFLELVELGEGETVTRRRVTKESLTAVADSPEQLEKLLGLLAKHRLLFVTTDKKGRDEFVTYVEVTHEALLSKWEMLKRWIEEDRDVIRLKRRFEADFLEWRDRYDRSEEALLGGLRLSDVVEWCRENHPRLSSDAEGFIEASLVKREKEQQEKLAAAEAKAKAEEERAKEAEARALAELEKKVEAEKRAEAEEGRAKEAEARVKVQKQRTRILTGSGLIVALLFAFLGLFQIQSKTREAQLAHEGKVETLVKLAESDFENNRQLEALMTSVQALAEIKNSKINAKPFLPRLQTIVYSVREFNRLEGHEAAVWGVSVSPQGQIVSSDSEGVIKIWSSTGKLLKTLDGHEGGTWNITYDPTGQTFASVGYDGKIKIWDTKKRGKKNEIDTKVKYNYGIDFTKEGNIFASSGYDGKVKIWSMEQEKSDPIYQVDVTRFIQLSPIQSSTSYRVININFNPVDSSIIAYSGDYDGNISIWNWKNNEEPISIGKHSDTYILDVRFNHDGTLIASSGKDGTIKIWDIERRKLIGEIGGHQVSVPTLSFSADGQYLASGSDDDIIKVWKVDKVIQFFKKNKQPFDQDFVTLKGHAATIKKLEFSSNSKLLISAAQDKTVRLWKWQPNSRLKSKISTALLFKESCEHLKDYLQKNETLLQTNLKACSQFY